MLPLSSARVRTRSCPLAQLKYYRSVKKIYIKKNIYIYFCLLVQLKYWPHSQTCNININVCVVKQIMQRLLHIH